MFSLNGRDPLVPKQELPINQPVSRSALEERAAQDFPEGFVRPKAKIDELAQATRE